MTAHCKTCSCDVGKPPAFGTVPGDGWAAPETEADYPLRLVTDEESDDPQQEESND